MDTRTSILSVILALLAALTRAFNVDTTFSTLTKKVRALILAGLGIAQAVVDNLTQGTSPQSAILSALATTGPSFVILIVEYLSELKGNAGTPSGTGTIDLVKAASKLPPPSRPPSAAMVGLGLAFLALLVLSGCAMSLDGAHKTAVSNRAVAELGGVAYAPDSAACASLDAQHRTWGALGMATGLLAGTGGVTTLPIPDGDKTARIAVAVTSLALGAFAATAVFVQQDFAGAWSRECTGTPTQAAP